MRIKEKEMIHAMRKKNYISVVPMYLMYQSSSTSSQRKYMSQQSEVHVLQEILHKYAASLSAVQKKERETENADYEFHILA